MKKQIFIGSILILLTACMNKQNNAGIQDNALYKNQFQTIDQCYFGIDQSDTTKILLTHAEYKRTGKTPHLSNHEGYSMSFYGSNGQIASEGFEQNMKKNGIWLNYYQNGKIKSIISYWNGQEDGITKLFYENGNIRLEGYHFRTERPKYKEAWEYSEEQTGSDKITYLLNPEIYRHGVWNEYSENGELNKSTTYNMGEIIERKEH